MNYKIFIINLDRSPERLQHALAQLAPWPDLPIERVPATDGRALPEEDINRYYNLELNRRVHHKILKPGEKGVFISHIHCWQKIIEENLDFALVLEDDFEVTADLSELLNAIGLIKEPWHFLKLAMPHKQQKIISRKPVGAFELVHYKKNPISAVAQAVSHEGAHLLLKREWPFGRPVDVAMQYSWQLGFRAMGLQPLAFRPASGFASTIASKQNKQVDRGLFYRLRLAFWWHNFRHNIRTYGWRATLTAQR